MSTVIKIEKLFKEYRLGVIGHGTLYRDLQTWWAKIKGREDPNSLIGKNNNNDDTNTILALNNIDLKINDGEVLGIIGSNGAGKSTLLKILSRVTAPTSGSIKIKGRIASLLEVGTGFHPELTGKENIYLNGAINGMSKREVTTKLDEIVEFSGVNQFLDTPVKRYSSGMYVRLGFAVAAHLDPDILVVDEVLAVGDASFQDKAINKMKDVSKGNGRTVLFVSHNMGSIKKLCNRCILLDKGSVVMDDVTDKVVDKYLNLNVKDKKAIYDQTRINDIKHEKIYHGVKFFEINEVSIFDEKRKEKLEYYSDESIFINIKFTCLQEVERFRLGIYISNQQGTHLMSTIFTDDEKMLEHRNLKPGQHSWTCEISPNLFGSNEYLITIGLFYHTIHHLTLPNIFLLKTRFNFYNNVINMVNDNSPFKPKLSWRADEH